MLQLPIRPEDLTREERETIDDIVRTVQDRNGGIVREGERLDDRVATTLRDLFG